MNSKKILAFIVLAFLLFAHIEGLTIKSHLMRKNLEHNKVQKLVHEGGRHVKQMIFNHLDEEDNPMFALIASDPELRQASENGKPLSEDGVKKIKDFFLSNQEFKTMTLQQFGKGQGGAACFKNLTDSQKDKVFSIMVDKMPIANIFVVEDNRSHQDFDQLVEALLADQQLGPLFAKCEKSLKK